MGKTSIYIADKVSAILATNKKGDRQFGLREAFRKNVKALGEAGAKHWVSEHIEMTLKFRELLERNDWAAGDTETTGIGASAEICEVAFQPINGPGWEQIVKPVSQTISSGSEAVHGISNSMVKSAPTLKELTPKINRALKNYKAVVFYNLEYDKRIFDQSCYAAGAEPVEWPELIDVLPWFATWVGDWNPKQLGWRWPKLEGGHRALGDCQEMIEQMKLAATSDVGYAELILKGDEK